jgi:hypothetical protein
VIAIVMAIATKPRLVRALWCLPDRGERRRLGTKTLSGPGSAGIRGNPASIFRPDQETNVWRGAAHAAEILDSRQWRVASGKCTSVKASSLNQKTPGTPDSYPPQPNLAFAWEAIYGQGYFAAQILGRKIWQGIFTGNQGTVLQVEVLNQQHGAAVDNRGNIYKIVW